MKYSLPGVVFAAGVGVILVAILFGPMLSPPVFSWLQHTTSEQAGQHMPGAWLMRAGFVGYGLGTITAAAIDRRTLPVVRIALVAFGLGLIGTAIWSNASILPAVTSDLSEDRLHSIASGVVGTAFAAFCAARLFVPSGSTRDALAWTGLLASIAIPAAMAAFPDYRGLLQRAMFAISFVLIAREFGITWENSAKPSPPVGDRD